MPQESDNDKSPTKKVITHVAGGGNVKVIMSLKSLKSLSLK